MNTQLAQQKANDLMLHHGLIQAGWSFKYDNAKRRFGRCNYTKKLITLSLPLVELNSEPNVVDIILHEIAHALVGQGHDHNSVWQRKCIEIGAKPIRCYNPDQVNTPQHKYTATCSNCKHTFRRHRIKKHARQYCPCTSRNREPLVWVEHS